MPQLDTSTWSMTTLASTMTLFILLQLNLSSYTLPIHPSSKTRKMYKTKNPWELKWTKIYLPLLLPPQ
nr:ATP synthase F0 subunit 8 [Lophiomys imhausi]